MKTKLNTISNLSKGLMVLALTGSLHYTNAQEKQSNFTFGGNVDGYYKFDAGRHNRNSKTRFTENHNSFELGMASFEATHKTEKFTTFVDLGMSKRADQFSATTKNSDIFIKQLYVTAEIATDLTVTAGSWKKHYGYEHINAIDNANYSMSYGFSNSNFFNTGIKLDYKLEKFNFMAGITNASDFKSAIDAGSTQKNFIGQFGYNREKSRFIYSVQTLTANVFPKNTILNNFIIEHQFDDKLVIALDITNTNVATMKKMDWNAAAVYVKYALQENLNLNYRLEFLDTNHLVRRHMAFDYRNGDVVSNTFTAKYKVGGLTIIPELRLDASSRKLFYFNNEPSKFNAFLLLGTTYQF
jgi:hypothetical protein